jgi:hypothetical protein
MSEEYDIKNLNPRFYSESGMQPEYQGYNQGGMSPGYPPNGYNPNPGYFPNNYNPNSGMKPSGKKHSKVPIILLILCLVVVIGLIIGYAAINHYAGKNGASTPEKAARSYFEAITGGDKDALHDILPPSVTNLSDFDAIVDSFSEQKQTYGVSIGEIKITDSEKCSKEEKKEAMKDVKGIMRITVKDAYKVSVSMSINYTAYGYSEVQSAVVTIINMGGSYYYLSSTDAEISNESADDLQPQVDASTEGTSEEMVENTTEAETEELTEMETSENTSADLTWKDFGFFINGYYCKYPFSAEGYRYLGFDTNDMDNPDYALNKGETKDITADYGDNTGAELRLMNEDSEDKLLLSDCSPEVLTMYLESSSGVFYDFRLENGVKAGMTRDEVEGVMGSPSYAETVDGSDYLFYSADLGAGSGITFMFDDFGKLAIIQYTFSY